MLSRIKERLLGEARTVGAVADLKSLYDGADDPEAFHAALSEGDFEAAASYHPLTEDEIEEKFETMLAVGKDLSEEYDEVLEHDKEEFINA